MIAPNDRSAAFVHRYVPATRAGAPTLLLLHGTGGTEEDLIPLGRDLAPGAGLLGVRGKVSENGSPRFFRRLAEGVFDIPDLIFRTHELADFISVAAKTYEFDPARVVAAGYSNGANIAASMLLLRAETLAGAVLFRAMVPLVPDELPDLRAAPVFLSEGRHDPMVAVENAEQLAELLRRARAEVTLRWQPIGHQLHAPEIDEAKVWLNEHWRLTS